MRQQAFDAPGRFWRGNLHTHSNASDGRLPPGEVAARYAEAGYDFFCLSDHFVGLYGYPVTDTRGFRTNRFTTILGAEMHTGQLGNGEIWHLLAVGLPIDFAPGDAPDFEGRATGETAAALARRCREAGAFVALAHPEWNGLTPEDARAVDAAHAVEIYNHSCHITADRGSGIAVWDMLLNEGRRVHGCATDDAHFVDPDHFGGWVMVKAEANDPDALLAALKAGAYYSSTGPELRDVHIDGDRITVECSPAEAVIAMGRASAAWSVQGRSMTRAELPLDPFRAGGWVRIAVQDAGRGRAWSNPIWLD